VSDRYEPLPDLAGLPGWLLRKLSPRGRRVAAIAAAGLAVAVAVGLALAVPAIDRGKEERAADEARALERARAERTARLAADARPRRGAGPPARGLEGAAAVRARRAVVADLAAAVQRDAAARVPQTVLRASCERYPRGARGEDPTTDLGSRTGRYACLAVTRTFAPGETTTGGSIGYPYRAVVDFGTGRFAFCKISGRPGEGSIERTTPARVPPACAGPRR
jgi:hypothetical protein